jgi:hypothetical protein
MPYGEDGNQIPEDVRQRLNAVMAGVKPDSLPELPGMAIRYAESEFIRVRDQHVANRRRSEYESARLRFELEASGVKNVDAIKAAHDRGRSELLDLLASSDEAKAIRHGMNR